MRCLVSQWLNGVSLNVTYHVLLEEVSFSTGRECSIVACRWQARHGFFLLFVLIFLFSFLCNYS